MSVISFRTGSHLWIVIITVVSAKVMSCFITLHCFMVFGESCHKNILPWTIKNFVLPGEDLKIWTVHYWRLVKRIFFEIHKHIWDKQLYYFLLCRYFFSLYISEWYLSFLNRFIFTKDLQTDSCKTLCLLSPNPKIFCNNVGQSCNWNWKEWFSFLVLHTEYNCYVCLTISL